MERMRKGVSCNKNAQPEVGQVLEYLASIEGERLLTGQHTQTMKQEELTCIKEQTGEEPAVCGFELLSYSPNINYETCNEICMTEIENNRGTLQKAWEWAKKKGLITMCWHWYSPIGGKDKSFYAENTNFDVELALQEGTKEHTALLSDMDVIAGYLRPFCEAHIPILWRPFHESEGQWFWWGTKGPEAAGKLYRLMYERFTNHHHLNNLIWIWNCPLPEGYPGDDVVDILSLDTYQEPHFYSGLEEMEKGLEQIAPDKMYALAEVGVLPDITEITKKKISWLWYMTWSIGFVLTEEYSSYDELKRLYHHPSSVTLRELPALY